MAINKILQYPVHALDKPTDKIQEITLKISEENSMYTIHRGFIKQMTEHRQGTASCKTRSEVRGGGRKPWKQKGTGKARAGSTRSPLWRGGGVIFGPKSKIYKQKLNTKEKKLAIRNLLFNKKEYTIVVPEQELHIEQPKTKRLKEKIEALINNTSQNILVVVNKKNNNLYLASRNLKNVELIQANQLNIVSLLTAKIIIVSTEGLLQIEEVYNAE